MKDSVRVIRKLLELVGRQRGYTSRMLAAAQDGQAVILTATVPQRDMLRSMARDRMMEGVQVESFSFAEQAMRGREPRPVLVDNGLLEEVLHAAVVDIEHSVDQTNQVCYLTQEVERLRTENADLKRFIYGHLAPEKQDQSTLERFVISLCGNVDKLLEAVRPSNHSKSKRMGFIRGRQKSCTHVLKLLQNENA